MGADREGGRGGQRAPRGTEDGLGRGRRDRVRASENYKGKRAGAAKEGRGGEGVRTAVVFFLLSWLARRNGKRGVNV